ncbi:MAG: sigma-70 family RNA polymerase sigma factor [Acidimicrobiia bacterium]|nr:sigma-70 family RNA polymerase sigma factor [Acidimicrobiia bacterium]
MTASEFPLAASRVDYETGKGEAGFTAFVQGSQDAIRHALVAGFGVEVGRDAAAEAFVYAWQRWDRISGMSNPAGYVYRVGHRMAQKMSRRRFGPVAFPEVAVANPSVVEPGLPAALALLSPRQRSVVVTVHGYGLSQREAADLLGISRSSVQRHLERGLAKLRAALGVRVDD